jgi:hypothetical protein
MTLERLLTVKNKTLLIFFLFCVPKRTTAVRKGIQQYQKTRGWYAKIVLFHYSCTLICS